MSSQPLLASSLSTSSWWIPRARCEGVGGGVERMWEGEVCSDEVVMGGCDMGEGEMSVDMSEESDS